MTIEKVLQLLDSAMHSEQGWIEEFLRRRELLKAGEVQTRFRALEAFRHSLLENLALERGDGER